MERWVLAALFNSESAMRAGLASKIVLNGLQLSAVCLQRKFGWDPLDTAERSLSCRFGFKDSWRIRNFRRCVVVAQPVADFGRRHLLAGLVTSQKSLMRRTVASHASMNASPEQPVGEPSLLRLLQEMPTKNLARNR